MCICKKLNKNPSCQRNIDVIIWKKAFQESSGSLQYFEVLVKSLQGFDAAYLVLGKDDLIFTRGEEQATSRDNVWIELGLFYSSLGKERTTGIIFDKLKRPSDFDGLNFKLNSIGFKDKSVLKEKVFPDYLTKYYKLSDVKSIPEYILILNKSVGELEESILKTLDSNLDGIAKVSYEDDRKKCFDLGKKIIMDANEFIYSSISYESDGSLLKHIKKRAKDNSALKIKRWINVEKPKLFQEALNLLENYKNVDVKHLYSRLLEVVISEKEALIVIPGKEDDRVGHGIYIKDKKVIQALERWFNTHLPAPNTDKEITIGGLNNMIDYLLRLKNIKHDYKHLESYAYEKKIDPGDGHVSEFQDFSSQYFNISNNLTINSKEIHIIGNGNIGNAIYSGLNSFLNHLNGIEKKPFSLNLHGKDADLSNCISKNSIVFICIRTDHFNDSILSLLAVLEKNNCTLIFTQYDFPTEIEYNVKSHIRIIPNLNTGSNLGYTIILKNNKNHDYLFISMLLMLLGDYFEINSIQELKNYSLISGLTPVFLLNLHEILLKLSKDLLKNDKEQTQKILKQVIDASIQVLKDKFNNDSADYRSKIVSSNKIKNLIDQKKVINEKSIREIFKELK